MAEDAGKLRIVCISDTHGLHGKIPFIPPGDVLIHAGDLTNIGELKDIVSFRTFLASLPHRYQLIIAGNHDITIEKDFYCSDSGYKRFHRSSYKNGLLKGQLPEEYAQACIDELCRVDVSDEFHSYRYLQDEEMVLAGDGRSAIKVYGSPWQPPFCDWAFNAFPSAIREKWDLIPSDVDVLITHGPPHGILDSNDSGFSCGCPELLAQFGRIRPRLHVFGHIHEGYGKSFLFVGCVWVIYAN